MVGFVGRLSGQGATITAALIGAIIGTLGSVLLTDWLAASNRAKVAKAELVRDHLTQLQESAEQLWFRVANASKAQSQRRGQDNYEASMLYALGRYVATDRQIALAGLIPAIRSTPRCSKLGDSLKQQDYGELLSHRGLPYYDRLTLVGILQKDAGSQDIISNFYEFRLKFDQLSDDQKTRYFDRNLSFIEELKYDDKTITKNDAILEDLCRTINLIRHCIGDDALVHDVRTSKKNCARE